MCTNIIEPIKFTKVTRNISETDVAVVGGRIANMTTAYLVSKAGKKVTLVEDGYIDSSETGYTATHITHALDDRFYNLQQVHGIEGSRIAAESHTAVINLIESIGSGAKIDCDFEKVYGFFISRPKRQKRIARPRA